MSDHPDRTEKRFRVNPKRKLQAEMQAGEQESLPVSLINISHNGAKFSTESSLSVDEAIRVRLTHRKLGLEIALPAVVRWCHVKKDHWEVGVHFTDAVISDDVLDKLAMSGVVERRWAERHPVKLPGKLQTPGEFAGTSVVVSDVSTDGTCIVSPKPVEIGERLLLTLNGGDEDTSSFVAISRWQTHQNDQFHVGCHIPETPSRSLLKTCGVETDKPRREVRRASWLTWLVLLVCAGCTWSFAYTAGALPPEVTATIDGWQIEERIREWWPW